VKRIDATISECNFGEDAVLYLYGELPDTDRVVFESHLLDCTACTDEFASMASARYEVYDWKTIEFDPLATPRFEIPFEEQHAAGTRESWADRVRSTFARGWAVPGLAFAGLVVVSIVGAVFLSSSGGSDEIASATISVDNRAVDVTASRVVEPSTLPSTVDKGDSAPPTQKPQRAAVPPVVRSDRRSTARIASPTPPKRTITKPESTRAVKVDVPRLNGFPEDEDTSLRLAELLEDGETRD
jgi:anti-sigma factor RsiW